MFAWHLNDAETPQTFKPRRNKALYFLALATDYDGTIAGHGFVDPDMQAALERFKQTGRRLILVTGRDLPDLKQVYPGLTLFDRVVAENGAVIYDPATEKARTLAPAPPAVFVEKLRERNIQPLFVGESIVATHEPNETIVLEVIRALGLELQIIFNKGSVMVLPSGMNKAKGLRAALADLGLSMHNVVGVGDAQNDHAFLRACGCAAAVANALPLVKESADILLSKDHSGGVMDLLDMICRNDGTILPPDRHGLLVGHDTYGRPVYLEPHLGSVLISGRSGIGKSNLATALAERMVEKGFEFCVFDPEGDYADLEDAVSVGSAKDAPNVEEVLKLLRKIGANVVVNTQALDAADRPRFFAKLLPQIASLRARTGRPHWLIIDEAHHLLPSERGDAPAFLPDDLPAAIFITVHPKALSEAALKTVDTLLALGESARETVAEFCQALEMALPATNPVPDRHEILFWRRDEVGGPYRVRVTRPQQSHQRHTRKYADGDVGHDLSFYFRGPERKLNLRAQNLTMFTHIANGVDDATWDHHRQRREYSAWFRNVIKDDELADEAFAVEADDDLAPDESRKRIIEAVSRRYTAPALGSDR